MVSVFASIATNGTPTREAAFSDARKCEHLQFPVFSSEFLNCNLKNLRSKSRHPPQSTESRKTSSGSHQRRSTGISALSKAASGRVNDKRGERTCWREGLKAPARQSKRGRIRDGAALACGYEQPLNYQCPVVSGDQCRPQRSLTNAAQGSADQPQPNQRHCASEQAPQCTSWPRMPPQRGVGQSRCQAGRTASRHRQMKSRNKDPHPSVSPQRDHTSPRNRSLIDHQSMTMR